MSLINSQNSVKICFLIAFVLGVLIFPSEGYSGDGVDIQVEVISPPAVCGNDVQETGESCDGSDLIGQNCVTLGYSRGTLSCNDNCTFDTSGCISGGGGGGGGGGYVPPVIETKVIIQGKSYPNADITILRDGQVSALIQADSQANFKAELTTLTAGIYTFGVWGKDSDGRKSIIFSFTTSVSSGTITTISGIFLPPTIEIDNISLRKGEILNILGQIAPTSEIDISIHSSEIIKKTTTDEEGFWDYSLDTTDLDEGTHSTQAKASSLEGLMSTYSQALAFNIGKSLIKGVCPDADLNSDDRVNLIDFSILLYWWGRTNECADQNSNGVVDLADFSIMMYWWTG